MTFTQQLRLDHAATRTANAAMLIYKIFRADEWDEMRAAGQSAGAPVDLADGFVHLSTATQVADTLARHFAHERDLRLLACAASGMGDALRWEPARGGALFPHLYRPLRMADIRWTRTIRLGANGHETGSLE